MIEELSKESISICSKCKHKMKISICLKCRNFYHNKLEQMDMLFEEKKY